jgi:ubiquinol-cytochrome c reductase cytochrome b subunit
MPTWEISFLGHTLSLTVLIPFIVPLGVVLGGAALWPFFERWATGDRSWRNVNDRPRNAPVRTATGIAAMTFYAVLWVEGGNDVIADKLSVPLYTITWTARVLVFAGLAVAFYLTRRICLGLQRKDQELLEHGLETGIIRQLPHGEFVEIHRPLTEEERAVLEAKKVPALMPAPRTTTACPSRRGQPSAGSGPGPTAPLPRPSWLRRTATATATGPSRPWRR